jgi:hypothetical protein
VSFVDRPWTGKLLRVDAAHLLRVSSRGMSHVALPRMLNSIVPREVLTDVSRAYGNVFDSIAPDHCFGYRCLDRVDTILHLDEILVVQRAMARSNGYSQTLGLVNADHEDFLRELRETRINERTPVPELLTVTNAGFNEYEYVRAEPGSSKLHPVRRHFYLGANARDVERLEEPRLQARMRAVLTAHGWSRAMRARYLVALGASAAGYYGRHPGALLSRLRDRPGPHSSFGDAEAALAFALAHPGWPSAHAVHLWPLMSRPRTARELPVPYVRAARGAPASGPRTGPPSRGRTTAAR